MSSKPCPAGATATLALIDQITDLELEEARLQREIDAVQPQVKRLHEVRNEHNQRARQLAEQLRSMDVHTPGNAGWEGRAAWFLGEIVRQARGGAP
jgi:uncharacterized protein YlxW (UPF0749 family)